MGRMSRNPTDPPPPPGFVLDEGSSDLLQPAVDTAATLEELRDRYIADMNVAVALRGQAEKGKPRPDIARALWNDLTSDIAELARNPPAGMTKEMKIFEMIRDDILEECRTEGRDAWAMDDEPAIVNQRLFRLHARRFDFHADFMRHLHSEPPDDEPRLEYRREQWYEIQKATEDLFEHDDLPKHEIDRLVSGYQKVAGMWRKLIGQTQLVTI